MLELEHGVVKFFDSRDGKLYGFLIVLDENGQKTDEELFFHFNDGEFVDIEGGDEIRFIGRVFTGGVSMWHPQVGDKLAFDRMPGKGSREKACPWTFAEGYDNRVYKLTEPYYRVIKDTKYGFGDSRDKQEIIWEGQGAKELSTRYPVKVLDGKLNDPLSWSANLPAGSTTHYLFMVWVSEDVVDGLEGEGTSEPGFWRPCDDPRERSEEARRLQVLS